MADLSVNVEVPLRAEIVLYTLDGTPVMKLPQRDLQPGDTISWTYPTDGIRLEITSDG